MYDISEGAELKNDFFTNFLPICISVKVIMNGCEAKYDILTQMSSK